MKSLFSILGFAVLTVAMIWSFGRDLALTRQDGAVDFRNRITGVRLLEHGMDPYHYIWHPGDPTEFCDIRNNPNMTVSKTTVSPTLLLVFAPLAALPYRVAQFTWLFAQWLFLFGTAWLWLRFGATALKRWIVAFFVIGFTFTPGWRWEAERGQCYLLLTFLLAYVLTSLRGESKMGRVAGVVSGWLAALRAPYLMLLPFLAVHRRRLLLGVAIGFAASVLVPMILLPSVWLDYASAMHTNSDYYRYNNLPPRPEQAFPETIEGVPLATMGNMVTFPYVDDSIYALARRFGLGAPPDLPVLLVFGTLFCAWLWWKRRATIESLLPGMAAWLFLSDFVMPTTRWAYYDIMILNVILAQIAVAKKFPCGALPGLIGVIVMWSYPAFGNVPLAMLFVPQALFVASALLALFCTEMPSDSNSGQAPT
jgi:hypothetical protein